MEDTVDETEYVDYIVTCNRERRDTEWISNSPEVAFYNAFYKYKEKRLILQPVDKTITDEPDVKVTEFLDEKHAEYKEYYYNLVPGEVPEMQKKYKERVAKVVNIVPDPEHPSQGKQLGE